MDRMRYVLPALAVILCLPLGSLVAGSSRKEFRITYPANNAKIQSDVIQVTGTGADPTGTLELEVITDYAYLQMGSAHIDPDGTWTFSPVYLKGAGVFNNHRIRATIVKNGQRGASFEVSGIVRK